jgi:hypothetical protein
MKEHYLKPPESQIQKTPDDKGEKAKDTTRVNDPIEKKESPEIKAIEYFEFKGWGDILLDDRLDVNGDKDKIIFIDNFINKQIKKQGIKDEKSSYFSILQQIEESLKISRFHEQNVRIDKVYKMMKLLTKTHQEKKRIQAMIMKANKEAQRSGHKVV